MFFLMDRQLQVLCLCKWSFWFLTEDYVGDACESDYDNDGVSDKDDDCPANAAISTTDLSSYTNINLYPELNAPDPAWLVLHDGKEVRQMVQTDMPAIVVGRYF